MQIIGYIFILSAIIISFGILCADFYTKSNIIRRSYAEVELCVEELYSIEHILIIIVILFVIGIIFIVLSNISDSSQK